MIRVYFSGSVTRPRCEQYLVELRQHRLVSFAYRKDVDKYLRWARGWGWENPHLMLDSGAFTAWSKGEEIDREVFTDYACRLQDEGVDLVVINLDRIPGEKGRDPTLHELDAAVLESHRNHEYLAERLGIDVVLPVFHQGESQEVLQNILGTGAPYVCISPRNDLHERFRVDWCNHTFQKIPSDIQVHGLATTGMQMMRSNAWFSVDSATYIMIAAYGGIWMGNNRVLFISADSGQLKEMGKHYNTLSPIEQEAVDVEIEDKGFTLLGLQEDHEDRALWNVKKLIENPIEPIQVTPGGLF